MTKKKFKSADELNIKDTVYQIDTNRLAEHLKLGNKVMNLNNLKYFSLEGEKIRELALGENDDVLIVNGEFKLPLTGRIKKKATDTLIDEREAVVMVITEIAKEQRKAWELAQIAEQCVESLEKNRKIYEDKAKKLGIVVEIEDTGKGSLLTNVDGEKYTFDDSEELLIEETEEEETEE